MIRDIHYSRDIVRVRFCDSVNVDWTFIFVTSEKNLCKRWRWRFENSKMNILKIFFDYFVIKVTICRYFELMRKLKVLSFFSNLALRFMVLCEFFLTETRLFQFSCKVACEEDHYDAFPDFNYSLSNSDLNAHLLLRKS